MNATTPEELAALSPEEQLAAYEQAERRLLSAIEDRENSAVGGNLDDTQQAMARAIDYYLGRLFGNEIEGRSQVVSRDVSDTIEWIMPSLMRIYTGGNEVCKFDAVGPEDEQSAQQETDYVNYVINKKNNWFAIAYEWFKDALLTRNAYTMAYWEDKRDTTLERYGGLTTDQLVMIAQDAAVEIVAHTAQQGFIAPFGLIDLHDVDVRRTRNYGCAKIMVLPPERCLVAADCPTMSVRGSSFFEYWDYQTISSLREEGFDVPDDISDSGSDMGDALTDQARDIGQARASFHDEDKPVDPAMRKVKVRTLWIRHDFDGDGISEYRYCVVIGKTILANDECSDIPIATIVPTPMPHRHEGLSVSDAVEDLQLIKSAMLRQVVDNQFLANNARTAVDKNIVNLDDMMVSRPGGVVRVNGAPQTAIMPFTQPETAQGGIAVLQYLDSIRQYRTGTQQPFVGPEQISGDALPGTVEQLTAAASQRVELIARVFAEGVKELFMIVHEVTLMNPTAIEKVQLRNKWVSVDPRQWQKRSDMTLSVGVAVGNKRQHVSGLQLMLSLARQALPFGLTSLNRVYNMLSELTKALGFASPSEFWVQPQEGATVQPPPDSHIEVAKINAQADVLVQQMKNAGTTVIEQIAQQSESARKLFETTIQAQSEERDRMVRLISEHTDRMQELRMHNEDMASRSERASAAAGESLQSMSRAAKDIADVAPKLLDAAEKAGRKRKATVKRGPDGSKSITID